ncbi:hypothetical protein CK203_046957 [Vitis vinifera]|uniref:Retrotransposon gag domain-containing protein n=1 Tax=Vitis vinifera TaxID=29760 RepID=A0A438HE94_VITVI|nr:hypothetical protein CK203_046957 [Vitis vinifera]
MATPSRSHSSGRGEEDDFEWRQTIEKRQLTSERQLKAILQETERLREENVVLCIQASTSGPPRRQRSRGQVANSRPQQEPESIYPGTTGVIPGACNVRPHEPHTPMPRAPREESSDSTHFSAKRQRDRRPQLSNSMRARLGPQELGRPRPPVTTTGHHALTPWDLSEAFVGQYLCSARHKQNISTLQNIKMQDNKSLREFVKRFGQAVLQVEACSMDAVLQIFKRSICPGTPFFESLAKKPPTTMDDLFRRANKYSMLEDEYVQPPSKFWLPDGHLEVAKTQGTDPSTRDHSKRCVFHKEHGHTTETCRSLQYLVEKLIKAGHLKQYLCLDTERKITSQHHNPGAPGPQPPPRPL